jgi:plasmid stability protein
MATQPIPYPLRMPDELRDQLTERARINGRSLNAEILGILQAAVSSAVEPIGIDVDALANTIADRVAAQLRGTLDK